MANFNFNKSILGGRLTADPELKTTANGVSVTSFTIAVNRRFKSNEGEQSADFINCVAWRKQAELLCQYFRKGSSVCIVGSIQTRSWTDDNGNKRFATDVVVDEVYFCDSKNDAEGNNTTPKQSAPQGNSGGSGAYMPDVYKNDSAPAFSEMDKDDDLPF